MSLDADLLDAHEKNDKVRLIELYSLAGDDKIQSGDIDAACFFFTHAYVFALEVGSPEVQALNKKLVRYGREVEQPF